MNWNRHDQHVVNTLVSGVEDLVSASAWDEATELAHRAIMTNPSSVVAHTSMARVLLAQGDLSGAELHHWVARLNTPRRTAAMHVNQAGIAEAYGDVIGAAAAWRRARKRNTKDIHIVAQYVGWLRRVGHLDRAMSVIEERRVGAKQSSEMLIESIRVRLERNELEAARMVWGRLANLYPDHPMTVALLKEIDG